jgi:hypothetical protein
MSLNLRWLGKSSNYLFYSGEKCEEQDLKIREYELI